MWQAVRRVLFWTYHRGTWQYDVIVVLILAFIFLTPKTLFDGTLLGRKAVQAVEREASETVPLAAKPSPAVAEEQKAASERDEKQEPPGR